MRWILEHLNLTGSNFLFKLPGNVYSEITHVGQKYTHQEIGDDQVSTARSVRSCEALQTLKVDVPED